MKERIKLRLGRFDIRREVIIYEPELAMAVTNNMVIFRAEMMLHKNAVEYMAISPMFDEIEEGEIAPIYEIIINENKEVSVKRRDV